MNRGNLGEWSEVYVFLKLLITGQVDEVNSGLQLSERKIQIARLLRDDSSGLKEFLTTQDFYETDGSRVSRAEINRVVDDFFEKLKSKSGSFELPDVQILLRRLGLTQIKASSREKIDLKAVVKTLPSGTETTLGYSIKSELGGSSTLLNASSHTLFSYRLQGDMDIRTYEGIGSVRQLVSKIITDGLMVEHLGPKSAQLRENLSFFGESLWILLSKALLGYFSGNGNSLQDLLAKISENNSELRRNAYQVGQFLKAIALGMTPGAEWLGDIEAYGGYILVTKSGQVIALPTNNEDEFRKYLLAKSYLDTPSTTRHRFGKLYEQGAEKFLDLSLQIRFA